MKLSEQIRFDLLINRIGKPADYYANKVAQLEAENMQLRRLAWRVFRGWMSWQEYFEALGGE